MSNLCLKEVIHYSRQMALPQIGKTGQEKLKQSSILCIGAGGLGSPALYYLVAAGIGKVGIIDGDIISSDNLQRQILYTEEDCGELKVTIASKRLKEINTSVEIKTYPENLSLPNALELISQYDIVLDGSDNYPTRYLVNDATFLAKKPLISASVYQFTGQLSVFNYHNGPCYRCLYPEAPPENLIPNCAESGILGATTGIIGSLAATEAIKIIVGLTPIYSSTLISIDTLSLNIKKLDFKKRDNCVLCSGKITSLDKIHEQTPSLTCTNLPSIEPHALKQLLEQKAKKILLVDVRSPTEFQAFNLPSSINIPIERASELPVLQKKLAPDLTIVYCLKGIRSGDVLRELINHGAQNVFSLKGGLENWLQSK
ncbi:MAG: molybdopterin biosynthesis protein MoeB [Gammaproteobacteria bacterium]|jgi:adenylyltransferase/sulfurtransferase|nr:molybdopterin biosynthesis protein MoeB [Gammaproteobacteria bacterium]